MIDNFLRHLSRQTVKVASYLIRTGDLPLTKRMHEPTVLKRLVAIAPGRIELPTSSTKHTDKRIREGFYQLKYRCLY